MAWFVRGRFMTSLRPRGWQNREARILVAPVVPPKIYQSVNLVEISADHRRGHRVANVWVIEMDGTCAMQISVVNTCLDKCSQYIFRGEGRCDSDDTLLLTGQNRIPTCPCIILQLGGNGLPRWRHVELVSDCSGLSVEPQKEFFQEVAVEI